MCDIFATQSPERASVLRMRGVPLKGTVSRVAELEQYHQANVGILWDVFLLYTRKKVLKNANA